MKLCSKEWGFLLKTLTMIDLYLTYVHVYSIHFNLKETSQQVGENFLRVCSQKLMGSAMHTDVRWLVYQNTIPQPLIHKL